jgi:hypothetical protein
MGDRTTPQSSERNPPTPDELRAALAVCEMRPGGLRIMDKTCWSRLAVKARRLIGAEIHRRRESRGETVIALAFAAQCSIGQVQEAESGAGGSRFLLETLLSVVARAEQAEAS